MAGLSLSQINKQLQDMFKGSERKFVFWYDAEAQFINDVDELELGEVKLLKLEPDEFFKTKILLEREDTENSYLIYAPFARPDNCKNHLADTILYSQTFTADRVVAIMIDRGIPENMRDIVEDHLNFFGSKERRDRFNALQIDQMNRENLALGMMCVLLGSKMVHFDEVCRILLTQPGLTESPDLIEFQKFNLESSWWELCSRNFAYQKEDPNLLELLISLFVTYAAQHIKTDIPKALRPYVLSKPGTVTTFLDQLKNNIHYQDDFNRLSDTVYQHILGEDVFSQVEATTLLELDIFSFADDKIISWIKERLLDQSLQSTIDNKKITDICKTRENMHYGRKYRNYYHMLSHAYKVIEQNNNKPQEDIVEIIKSYDEKDYLVDQHYRKFLFYLDQINNASEYSDLAQLLENIYIHKFLNPLDIAFNQSFDYKTLREYNKYKMQKNFYINHVYPVKSRLVVIISDALRYEIAKELAEDLGRAAKVADVAIEPIIGVLPSVTSVGMAALLPHKHIQIDSEYKVKVDNKSCASLLERQAILQAKDPNAAAINYDEIKYYSQSELRDYFKAKSTVYIYHNQIDARGDDAKTEDEVFNAADDAIKEIIELIRTLTNNVSITNFIVTADHGFIYRRRPIPEAEKIDKFFQAGDDTNRRYVISLQKYDIHGTRSLPLSDVLGEGNDYYITCPNTSNILKMSGGGQNFYHGACSPQEILLPLVKVKTIRSAVEQKPVTIKMITSLQTITNLAVSVEFFQTEALSDVIMPASFKIYFTDMDGHVISNIETLQADSKAENSAERITKLRFRLKDQKYNKTKAYLLAQDENSKMIVLEEKIIIDNAFTGGFGFDVQ